MPSASFSFWGFVASFACPRPARLGREPTIPSLLEMGASSFPFDFGICPQHVTGVFGDAAEVLRDTPGFCFSLLVRRVMDLLDDDRGKRESYREK